MEVLRLFACGWPEIDAGLAGLDFSDSFNVCRSCSEQRSPKHLGLGEGMRCAGRTVRAERMLVWNRRGLGPPGNFRNVGNLARHSAIGQTVIFVFLSSLHFRPHMDLEYTADLHGLSVQRRHILVTDGERTGKRAYAHRRWCHIVQILARCVETKDGLILVVAELNHAYRRNGLAIEELRTTDELYRRDKMGICTIVV